MVLCEEKIKFPFKCPVCKKSEFDNINWLNEEEKDNEYYSMNLNTKQKRRIDAIEAHFVHCEFCGWIYDLKQVLDNDVIGDRNNKSINELKKEYQDKIKINPDYCFDDEDLLEPHKCPVCGEYEFEDLLSYDICPICGWEDTGFEDDPNEKPSKNAMSFNERLKYFLEKREQNPNYKWKNKF